MTIWSFSAGADRAVSTTLVLRLHVAHVHPLFTFVCPFGHFLTLWSNCAAGRSEERAVSTTLLLLPEFLIGNVEAYTSFTDTVTQVVKKVVKKGGRLIVLWSCKKGVRRAVKGWLRRLTPASPTPSPRRSK